MYIFFKKIYNFLLFLDVNDNNDQSNLSSRLAVDTLTTVVDAALSAAESDFDDDVSFCFFRFCFGKKVNVFSIFERKILPKYCLLLMN